MENTDQAPRRSARNHYGAIFLMATSAIGPGFLTQTVKFTQDLGASFACIILISLLLDIGVQVNVWRTVTASGQYAPDLADRAYPGLGWVLTALIVTGGLAFNIGNIAGTGLGLEALAGIPGVWGATLSACLAILLFWSKEAGARLDRFAKILGLGMILLTAYVAWSAHPPLAPALMQSVWPERFSFTATLTLVGGTVGGYIAFAGAHRMLEAGVSDPASVQGSAIRGIAVATAMRLLLFLAAWGVVASGVSFGDKNPAAAMFQAAAGEWGARFFGLVMWAAAITSVTGATFTSLSFLSASVPALRARRHQAAAVFIGISLCVYCIAGQPVKILIAAGTLNGFILPLGLSTVLLAARRLPNAPGVGWQAFGWAVVAVMGWMAARSLM